MIKLLRTVRKSMIQTGATRKYIIYAFGEIALVVIGILIALQINNWNEYKKNRIKEDEVIKEIERTLENNIDFLAGYIADTESLSESNRIIIATIENDLPYNDSLDYHFHRSRVWMSHRFVSQAGYEELKNSGFDLIKDKRLKQEIIALFESVYPQMQQSVDIFKDGYWLQLSEYCKNNFYGIYQINFIKPINYNSLIRDQYYLSSLKEFFNIRLMLTRIYNHCLDETKAVQNLVSTFLKENE